MANINYSTEFEANRDLFYAIKTKHDADAATVAGSVLTIFLTSQGISLPNDKTLVDAADVAHKNFKIKEKESEKFSEQRRNLFAKPLSHVRQCAQNLKSINRGQVHELGDWGLTIDGDNRIAYPSEFAEIKEVVKTFINKHLGFPAATSPLKAFLDNHPEINLTQDLADVALAETADTNFAQATKDKGIFREARDTKWDLVEPHVLGIGQNLMSIFNNAPHKLGDWGFNIDEAAAKPKDRTLIVKPGTAKTIYKAVQQSVVKNNSTITVKIFPGKGTDGTPVELAPGASFPIKFRFGTFTVQNPSSSDAADLSATTYHT